MATQEAIKLSEGEQKALLFMGDQLAAAGTDTIESTGLAEAAVNVGICKHQKSLSVLLYKLKAQGLFESVRGNRVSLYALTEKGRELYVTLKDVQLQGAEPQEEPVQTIAQGEKKEMSMKSIEEQFREKGIEQHSYSAPAGVTLPKQGAYSEDLTGITKLYKDRINSRPDTNELERLNEWFTKLTAEGRPAFHWLQEAICRTSTKVKSEQRTLSYMIGILKNWGTYGYGSDYSAEHRKLFTLFEQRFTCNLSESSRQKLLLLLDNHGIVDTMTSLFQTTPEQIDPSMLFLIKMEETLNTHGE